MADRRRLDGELDMLLREHFAARVERERRDIPPVPATARMPARPQHMAVLALRAAGLAAAAALCVWAVGSGWGRSPFHETAARFAESRDLPRRIEEGLIEWNRILAGHFFEGGDG
jgi:hypothetical protein